MLYFLTWKDCSRKFRRVFPETPWGSKESVVLSNSASAQPNVILYRGKAVLEFPQGATFGEIDQKTTDYFLTLQRKKKLEAL
jgi:hypothetical protein